MAVAEHDPTGRGRPLRRAGLVVIIAYAVLTGLFVAAETFADPGGWRAVGLIGSWAVPLAALAVAAWYRPAVATAVLTAATVVTLGLGVWFAIAPQAWRSFEDHTGPVRALVSFVVAVPLGLLGWHRPVAAGLLLVVVGAAPALLADLAGLAPITALTSLNAVSTPPVLVGVLYLLSAGFAARRTGPARRVEADRSDSATARR